MKKKVSDCMQQKMQLIEKMEQISTISVEEWSAYTHQWRKILHDMCIIAQNSAFRSRKEECFFYENQFFEVHCYYLYCREMTIFHSLRPSFPSERNAYISQQLLHYKQYRLQAFYQYNAFCSNELQTDYTEGKAYILAKDAQEEWPFFDPNYPAFYGVYFSALALIIKQLEGDFFYRMDQSDCAVLQWKRSKIDLCLLVYTASCCNGEYQDRDNLITWADAFGALFGIKISKNFFQTLHACKKRKNFEPNFVTEMHQHFKGKWEEYAE